MASEWARSQREGWLCYLYGEDNEDGTRTLSRDSVQYQLVDVLEHLLSFETSAKDAAAQTAFIMMAQKDVGTPWSNHMGMHLKAAESFDNEKVLQALVDYLVELATLPDTIHKGPELKTVETNQGTKEVELGQPIDIDGSALWRDLPEYSMNLGESLQGECV